MKSFRPVIMAIAILFTIMFDQALGHGMLLSPPGRSSRWRYDSTAPVNYDDNGYYCGGITVQWNTNGGKCGLCGDNYSEPTPRANELGGKYGGTGVIVETYENTYTANVGFKISTNHLGFVSFELCNLDESKKESEECFKKHRLNFADGSDKLYIGTTSGWIDATVVLPSGLSCNHCVLRWTYTAGNNWGTCENGQQGSGCGPQETFKSCADIRIKAPGKKSTFELDSESINDEIPIEFDYTY